MANQASITRSAPREAAPAAEPSAGARSFDLPSGVRRYYGLQLRGDGSREPDPQVAAGGLSGTPSELPHGDRIQASFGRHDVRDVKAYVGGAAAEAARNVGAVAYAMGRATAFRDAPDLHTAAHEAAHVVQQTGGVHLAGGVGRRGDAYELHADHVADAVVAGRSAEALLDEMAPRGASGGAPALQKIESDFKDGETILGMQLRELDRYAHRQADWSTGGKLGELHDPLLLLLEHVRADNGLLLGAFPTFTVAECLAGDLAGNPAAVAYALSCREGLEESGNTVAIIRRAQSFKEALAWGAALVKLKALPGSALNRCIPQTVSHPSLAELVAADVVDKLIAFVSATQPLLCDEKGNEVSSFIAFDKEGGNGGELKAKLPWIRNLHRFEMRALAQQCAFMEKAGELRESGLPVTLVLLPAADHNGAFHRNGYVSDLVLRPRNITIILESRASLDAFSAEAIRIAQTFGKKGKLDYVVIAGHGSPQSIALAGDANEDGEIRKEQLRPRNHEVFSLGKRVKQALKSDEPAARAAIVKLWSSESYRQQLLEVDLDVFNDRVREQLEFEDKREQLGKLLDELGTPTGARDPSTSLLETLTELLDGEEPRVVLRACQTDMQTSSTKTLKAKVEEQVKKRHPKALVIGAHATVKTEALFDSMDEQQRITLKGKRDPMVAQGTKLDYLREGTEPQGVLWACWAAREEKGWVETVHARATAEVTGWRPTLIKALLGIVLEQQDPELMKRLAELASPLGDLSRPDSCRVGPLCTATGLKDHAEKIFGPLMTTKTWAEPHVPLVVYQWWMQHDETKRELFLGQLNECGKKNWKTQTIARYLDLERLKDHLPLLFKIRSRGTLLLALVYVEKQKQKAPSRGILFVKSFLDPETQRFREEHNVHKLLSGSEQSVLDVLESRPTNKDKAPPDNLDVGHSGENHGRVKSITRRAQAAAEFVVVLGEPKEGEPVGKLAQQEVLQVIGETGDGWLAIEHKWDKGFVGFVRAAEVKLL